MLMMTHYQFSVKYKCQEEKSLISCFPLGGDNTAPSTAVKKSKVRGHHHIRRRRRMSGEDEGDLSEGEDAMAAGDAGR